MANIYKAMLLIIIEPLCAFTPEQLQSGGKDLCSRDDALYQAVGDMTLRAAKFLEMSLAIAREQREQEAGVGDPGKGCGA